jgi:hypothetical protein
MNVSIRDAFDPWELFKSCVEHTGDKGYCRKAVNLLVETQARQVYTYGDRVRFHAVLPTHMIRRFAIAFDRSRRAAVVFLDIGCCSVALYYERVGDDFRLKFVDWITTELKALKNPPPHGFTLHL